MFGCRIYSRLSENQTSEMDVSRHNDLLKAYWEKGLTGTNSKAQKLLADELARETGLTISQIQVPLYVLTL